MTELLKPPIQRGATKSRICGMVCDEHGSASLWKHKELEASDASVFLTKLRINVEVHRREDGALTSAADRVQPSRAVSLPASPCRRGKRQDLIPRPRVGLEITGMPRGDQRAVLVAPQVEEGLRRGGGRHLECHPLAVVSQPVG